MSRGGGAGVDDVEGGPEEAEQVHEAAGRVRDALAALWHEDPRRCAEGLVGFAVAVAPLRYTPWVDQMQATIRVTREIVEDAQRGVLPEVPPEQRWRVDALAEVQRSIRRTLELMVRHHWARHEGYASAAELMADVKLRGTQLAAIAAAAAASETEPELAADASQGAARFLEMAWEIASQDVLSRAIIDGELRRMRARGEQPATAL